MKVRYKDYIDEENKTVIVEARVGNEKFYGEAKCHPEDKFNWLVGFTIANKRATIQVLKNELEKARARKEALFHVYDCIRQQKDFEYTKQTRLLERAFKREKAYVEDLQVFIKDEKDNLKFYLEQREKYAKRRENKTLS